MATDIFDFLESAYLTHNVIGYIDEDPISIPHQYSLLQDIEITAFWVAMLAWGQRKTIINKGNELFKMMDNSPYDFIINHEEVDLKPFLNFKHRTFQATDTLYFIAFLKHYYSENHSLETAFSKHITEEDEHVKKALIGFHKQFFDLEDAPQRTRKHVSTPERNSACKRLNMFLRWMVRSDDVGVDFGLWKQIKMRQLIIPLDVHVDRVARKLNLLKRKQTDWKAAVELTETLKLSDPNDPVKYDYALFGEGLQNKKNYLM